MNYHSQIASWQSYVDDCKTRGDGFQQAFSALVRQDIEERSIQKLLDIGCGPSIPTPMRPLRPLVPIWDGVEPSEEVFQHPDLSQRWQGTLEQANIADASYPFALAYNVVEHVVSPRDFLNKLHTILMPGGVFWALTPNAHHPFARLSRGLEVLGLKEWMAWLCARRAGRSVVNDYPAYYRLNSRKTVDRFAEEIGFSECTFHYFPSPQWAAYFPRSLQFFPRTYDAMIGNRIPSRSLLMAMRLVK